MDQALKITKTEKGIEGVLYFKGDQTLTEAGAAKLLLLEASDSVDTLYLDLQDIAQVDTAFIQLLCAAHREFNLSGKEIYLQNVPPALGEFLATAGYTKRLGCEADALSSCLYGECLSGPQG